jgi:Zn-dependent peptidase ImmA (M78 family)
MPLFAEKVTEYFPDFNKREHLAEDFWLLAKSEKIVVKEERLLIQGYYKVYKKKPVILINSDLPPLEWLKTAFHEITHHILDSPYKKSSILLYRDVQKLENKQEERAEAVALILLVPQWKLKELENTPFDQLHPYTQELLTRRQYVFRKYGI